MNITPQIAPDWESRDWYVGPPELLSLPGQEVPYNLFGLKGRHHSDIQSAWYGPPTQEARPTLSGFLLILPALLGLGILALTHRTFDHFLSHFAELSAGNVAGYLLLILFVVLVNSPANRQRNASQKAAAASAQAAGQLTVRLHVREQPGADWGERGTPPLHLTRRRGDPPQWVEDLPGRGVVYVTLDGLTPQEAAQLSAAISNLTVDRSPGTL